MISDTKLRLPLLNVGYCGIGKGSALLSEKYRRRAGPHKDEGQHEEQ